MRINFIAKTLNIPVLLDHLVFLDSLGHRAALFCQEDLEVQRHPESV